MTGPVTVAFRRLERPNGSVQEKFLDAGQNPPDGVVIHYWLRDRVDNVRLSILDNTGMEVRTFSSKREKNLASEAAPTEGEVQQVTGEEEVTGSESEEELPGPWAPNEAGMNRLVWDYRYEKPTRIESGSRGSREEALENVGGPRAIPGKYQVRLTVGDQTLAEEFSLLVDPRLPVSADELRAQFELKVAIRDRTSETNTAINQIRRLRKQVEDWDERAADRASVHDAAKSLAEQLKGVEGELINLEFEKPRPGPNRIKEKFDALNSMIDESDHAPTQGAHEVYDMLRAQQEAQLNRLKVLNEGPIASFNELIRAEGVPAVGLASSLQA
jgi:hypothetical protein